MLKKLFIISSFFSLVYPMKKPKKISCNIDRLCQQSERLRNCFREKPIERNSGEPLVVVLLAYAAERDLLTVFNIAKECAINFAQIKNKRGLTPLHFAAHNNSKNVVQFLLDENVPVDPVDDKGRTPFQLAIAEEYLFIALLLLNRGADIDHLSSLGTALTIATTYQKTKAVSFLLKHNANPAIQVNTSGNPNGSHNALQIAQLIAPKSPIENLLYAYTQAPQFGVCGYCKKDNCTFYCSECKTVYYCSKVCQKKHYQTHANLCAEIKQYIQSID